MRPMGETACFGSGGNDLIKSPSWDLSIDHMAPKRCPCSLLHSAVSEMKNKKLGEGRKK